MRPVVAIYKIVTAPSLTSNAVTGSSDSKTILCLVPLSWIKSPRTTVTDPLAKLTATWLRSSSATNADTCFSQLTYSSCMHQGFTGNCLLPFWIPTVHRHFGPPVFFSILSRAQTFRTGSLERSSAIVMRKEVFGTCFSCTIDAAAESAALKERITLNERERMRTFPLESPKKRLSAPVAMDNKSF